MIPNNNSNINQSQFYLYIKITNIFKTPNLGVFFKKNFMHKINTTTITTYKCNSL